MNDRSRKIARWMLWALPMWALMLLLGTLTSQPDPQTQFGAFAEYITTDRFLISHLVNSILGAAIGSLGFVALMMHLSDTRAAGRAWVGMLGMVAGNTLTAAVFGAAAFVQPAMGRLFLSGQGDALALYNDVYAAPLFGTAVVGLLLFMIGGVVAGLAVSASGRLRRWPGWLLAIAVPLFAVGSTMVTVLVTPAATAALVATLAIAWFGGTERETELTA